MTSTSGSIPQLTLGWRLKMALDHADLSVQEMADHLDYSRGQLSRYLNDKGEPPRRPVLREWALRCGVPFEWLAYGIDPTGPNDPDERAMQSFPCISDNVRTLRPSPVSPTTAEPLAA